MKIQEWLDQPPSEISQDEIVQFIAIIRDNKGKTERVLREKELE